MRATFTALFCCLWFDQYCYCLLGYDSVRSGRNVPTFRTRLHGVTSVVMTSYLKALVCVCVYVVCGVCVCGVCVWCLCVRGTLLTCKLTLDIATRYQHRVPWRHHYHCFSMSSPIRRPPATYASCYENSSKLLGPCYTGCCRETPYDVWFHLTRGRPGAWETDLVHFIINGNIN